MPPRTRLRRTGASIATTTSGSWLGGCWSRLVWTVVVEVTLVRARHGPGRCARCRSASGRCAEDAYPPGGVLDDGQDVQAGAGQRRRFEEVSGDDGVGLAAQDRCPGVAGALGPGRYRPRAVSSPTRSRPRPLHRVRGVRRGFCGIPRAVLAGQAQHQPADGSEGRGLPARLGRESTACRRAVRLRCQRSTVSGRTSSRISRSTSRAAGAAERRATPGRPG